MLVRRLNEHPIWKQRVRVFGRHYRAPSFDRFVSLWLHKLGLLGTEEIKILVHLIHKGMTVVDAGANQGLYTLLIADLVRPGRVWAFEPEPRLYRQLVSNVEDNAADNVTCYQVALSDAAGSLALARGGLNWGDNRIVAGHENDRDGIQVKAATLDEMLPNEKIDFVKIDVQGWEAQVLAGARQTLQRNPDLILIFEFWPYGLAKAGTNPDTLLDYLQQSGFGLWRLRGGRLFQLRAAHLPDRKEALAYCNLVGTKNGALLKGLII
jgi:FkbM family methyltransferase